MPVPRIQKNIQETNLQKDVLDLLIIVRPNWVKGEGVIARIRSRVLTGGLTNKIFAFWHATNPDDLVVVKLFGVNTDLMIDRDGEIDMLTLLNEAHCGPQLYAIFENGLCYEFLHGNTLTMETVRSPKVYPLIAKELAKVHKSVQIPLKYGDGSNMWSKMQLFLGLLADIFKKNVRLKLKLDNEFNFTLSKATQAVEELKRILKKQHMPIGFCHNDLLLGNIIYNADMGKVTFIDFEYAFPNYIPFDVANHFNEFAGLDEPDYTKCPSPEFRRRWVQIYLEALKPERVYTLEDFERWVYLCIPASHLFYALWGAVQAHYSDIDFDYEKYVGQRFVEYERAMAIIHGKKIIATMIGN